MRELAEESGYEQDLKHDTKLNDIIPEPKTSYKFIYHTTKYMLPGSIIKMYYHLLIMKLIK